jgi:Cu(I)/Ag(I) efflux system membrane fusion protein
MTDAREEGGPPPDDRAPPGVRPAAAVRWTLVAAMAIAALASVAYKVGWFRAGASSATGGASAEKVLYQCPMHPAIIQDHPGECPICGMTLVRRTAGDIARAPSGGADAGAANGVPGLSPVDLTPERIQLIGMRTAMVERAPLADSLRTVGVVAANERGLAQVSVRFSGWVQQLLVAETGRRVKKGEVLATIYSPEVVRAEQELLTARGWAAKEAGAPRADEAGGTMHDLGDLGAAARRRLELLGVAPPEIDAVIARGKPADSVPIRSPVDGFVTARNVVPGAAVQPGPPLFEVANLSRVWVLADVFEQDAARLHVGQKGSLELAAFPGDRFEGRVQFIYPTVAAATRTLKVRLELANKSGPGGVKLRPGMYGNVALALPAASGLVVPAEALVDTGDHQYVFVATGGGHFEPRSVTVGVRTGDKVQIVRGVSPGETVVATGNFLVDSESRLRAAIAGQAAAAPGGGELGPDCAREFDARKFPDKTQACRACEVQHRGMGTMVEDCKNAIAKPWK